MKQPHSTHFMLLRATRHWAELTPPEQRSIFDDVLDLVFNRYPALRLTHFAVSAGARGTHLLMWEIAEAEAMQEALDCLHAQAFFGAPLFELVELITARAGDSADDEAPATALAMLSL